MRVLVGHTSPESAYVVQDYPYGFRLRCQMRYWVEYKRGHGCRVVSQTSNPKRGGMWNKPKAGTYYKFGAVLVLDVENYVQTMGLTEYSGLEDAERFQAQFAGALPCDDARAVLQLWIDANRKYEEAKAAGQVESIVTITTPAGVEVHREVIR